MQHALSMQIDRNFTCGFSYFKYQFCFVHLQFSCLVRHKSPHFCTRCVGITGTRLLCPCFSPYRYTLIGVMALPCVIFTVCLMIYLSIIFFLCLWLTLSVKKIPYLYDINLSYNFHL